jgi:glycosyltransferase involved in cell wall biosynthesis
MVTTFYPPYHLGGDATYVRALSKALIKRGHQVTVVHCEDAYRLKVAGEPDLQDECSGISVHRIKSKSGILSPLITQQLGVPGVKKAELREILSDQFDVVNFHNISLVGGPGIISLSQAPVNLYTLHEHWLLCATHIFWKDRKKPCDSRQCIRCCIKSGIPPQLWRYTGLIKRNLEKIDSFIAPSEYTARRHSELINMPAPTKVIPLFSNLSPDQHTYTGSDKLEFIYVGRMDASKGIAQLLSAFAKWPDYHLTMIGDGELLPGLKSKFRNQCNIHFQGPVPQHKLIEYYRRATALILPSLAPETFGLTVIEAFACGTPAIVRIAGGSREMIDKNAAGFVYSDESQLLAAVQEFAHNRGLRAMLGTRARGAYEQHYTEEIHLSRYMNLVESLMHKKTELIGVHHV